MRAGARVELRDPAEILATLDESGSLDGVPFMPEMLGFFGRRFGVGATLDRVCDTVQPIGLRAIPDAVLLEDIRCDGSAHAGCQAECRLYWKNAWLRPVENGGTSRPGTDSAAYDELERLAQANVLAAGSSPEDPTYRCQHTELRRSSEPVGWWDPRSFLGQLTTRNVGIGRFVRVMSRAVLTEIGVRLRLVSNGPRIAAVAPEERVAPEPRGLAPGQLVRIRSKEEIAKTLEGGKNRGLVFDDREMLLYAGRLSRVRAKIERFVDEKTGRLVTLRSDCYSLEGVICGSDLSDGRWFCPRGIYSWWRECWLEPVDERPSDL